MAKDSKPILINLLAIAKYDHMPEYPIQFMTTGHLDYKDHDDAVIRYTETQQEENSDEVSISDITLTISKNRVMMEKKGDFSNTMVFSRGQRFEGTYKTPYGDMDMAVFSKGVQCKVGEKRGAVHLNYQLDIQGTYASTNELHLEYTAEEQE